MTTPFASRGASGFAGAVCAGCISAAIFVMALSHMGDLVSFIFYLTAIPVFIAGMGVGALAGLVASTTGLVGVYYTLPASDLSFVFLAVYALACSIPAALLTMLALRRRAGPDQNVYWYPEGHLLIALVLYPCVLFVLLALSASSHPGGLLALTNEYFQAAAQAARNAGDTEASLDSPKWAMFLKFLPAFMGIAWALVTGLSMVLAQSMLQQHKWNLRATNFTLRDLYLPDWPIVALAVTGLAGVFAPAPLNYIGANIAVMLGLLYLFVGLAVIHAWAESKKYGLAFLIFFYVILFYFVGLVVVLLGVIDQWANFRQRINKNPKTNVN